jgi:hypothetical protein
MLTLAFTALPCTEIEEVPIADDLDPLPSAVKTLKIGKSGG